MEERGAIRDMHKKHRRPEREGWRQVEERRREKTVSFVLIYLHIQT